MHKVQFCGGMPGSLAMAPGGHAEALRAFLDGETRQVWARDRASGDPVFIDLDHPQPPIDDHVDASSFVAGRADARLVLECINDEPMMRLISIDNTYEPTLRGRPDVDSKKAYRLSDVDA